MECRLGFTYKVFTLDLRYYDNRLDQENCNYLTADQTAAPTPRFWSVNLVRCGIHRKFSFDLTLANLK